jgi:NAD(P)-dependent dehydrogenase (short-subunit alcohol dehydrogenase family)
MSDQDHAAPAAIIAGVGPGMGLAVARRFASEGYSIGLIARDPIRLVAYADDLARHGGRIATRPADLSDLAATRNAVTGLAHDFGAVSALVYNGARWNERKALDLDPEEFHRDLALDCTSALVAIQAVRAAMARAGGGSCLLTGGGLALYPEHGGAVPSLTAGKSALRGLAHAIAPELAAEGIHLALVTIAGVVAEGTALAPDRIAERYWTLHTQPRSDWSTEIVVGAS